MVRPGILNGISSKNKFIRILEVLVMRFLKEGNIYKIIRITGSQDNILGLVFENNNNPNNNKTIEVIEWSFSNIKETRIETSKEEVLKQVTAGLKSVNESLGTNYKISKIYFSPFDLPRYRVYVALTSFLIRHYD